MKRGLIDTFKNKKYVTIEKLDIGDIQIYLENNLFIIIERKTVNDLVKSIIDGRYREQKSRILKSGINSINVMYLIEGSLLDIKSDISMDSVWGAITNTQFRDKMRVFRVESFEETVIFLEKIYTKLDKGEYQDNNKTDYIDTNQSKKKYNSPDNCFMLQLSNIPGVSTNYAKEIIKVFPNMLNLCTKYNQIDVSECNNLLKDIIIPTKTGKKRKLGKITSERIYKFISGIK